MELFERVSRRIENQAINALLSSLLEQIELNEGKTLLYYNCGPKDLNPSWNYIAQLTHKHNIEVVGTDTFASGNEAENDTTYCLRSKSNILDPNYLQEFPFQQNKFDYLLSVNFLHQFENLEQILRRFYVILKPGGYGVLIVNVDRKIFDVYMKLQQLGKFAASMENFNPPQWYVDNEHSSEISLRIMLHHIGFKVQTLQACTLNSNFASETELEELYIKGVQVIDTLPENLREEFKNNVKNEILIRTNRMPDGMLNYTYEILSIVVQKPKEEFVYPSYF